MRTVSRSAAGRLLFCWPRTWCELCEFAPSRSVTDIPSYLWYQTNSHRSLYSDVFNHDLLVGESPDKAVEEEKLSLSECLLALVISVSCVCCIAYLLVDQIYFIVEERHVKDAFVGLILVPVIEKAAEHMTAVGDASDNRMNFALFHVVGSCI